MASVLAPAPVAAPVRQAPQTPFLPEIKKLLSSSKPGDSKKAVDAFPAFMVRCFLKESDNASTGTPAIEPFKNGKFLTNFGFTDRTNWDLIHSFDEKKCRYAHALSHHVNICTTPSFVSTGHSSSNRFSLQGNDRLQNTINTNLQRYNSWNSQLTPPPFEAGLVLEDIKAQDMSAMDLFILCFCSGLREAYCMENGCVLEMNFHVELEPKTDKLNPEIPKTKDLPLVYEEFLKQKKPLPDSVSCEPSAYLKTLIDNHLKPDSSDSPERRVYKERAFARLCSLLIWVFKDAKHNPDEKKPWIIRQNALLVPLCFLPFVSVVCHKILNYHAPNQNKAFPCLTDQNDNRKSRPKHSLIGYIAVIPQRPSDKPNKDIEQESVSSHDDPSIWQRFLPRGADDNSFFFHFTKMSQDRSWKVHSDLPEGRYVSLLSHYVHLLLEEAKNGYPKKKSMYSVHFDNLITTIWASTMFPWLITQKSAVPDYQRGNDDPNVPFRRDFANLRCQNVPYLYDASESSKPIQKVSYDDAECFALSFREKILDLLNKFQLKFSAYCQAAAAKMSHADISLRAILLLVTFFSLPWTHYYAGEVAFYIALAVTAIFSGFYLLVAYFLWRNISAPEASTFADMVHSSTSAFFLHRWATVRSYFVIY